MILPPPLFYKSVVSTTEEDVVQEVETIDHLQNSVKKQPIVFRTHISPKEKDAIKEQRELTDIVQIYTDGSSHGGGVGAAAVLIREGKTPRILRYHLGSDRKHTVYEAEVVGLTLAAKLIATEQDMTYPASILIDNRAAIQSGENSCTKPGGYLVEHFRRMTKQLAKRRKEMELDFNLTIRWIPGHKGVKGNELADAEAKEAAKGQEKSSARRRLPKYLQNEKLPDSISALKQWHQTKLKTMWSETWKKSPRYVRSSTIDPSMPSNNYIKLVATLSRRQTSILTQLRTNHAPLNQHLHRIGKSQSPHCLTCPDKDETVMHYLLDFTQYVRERHILSNALRRKADSLSFLLNSETAISPLM